jgi:putative SOS response-associated peptidase YedK
MCNRYATDIRKAGLERDYYGFEEWSETRIEPVLEVFPDRIGPVIRAREGGGREWVAMRWGLPGPSSLGAAPVTNVRNLESPHWRALLGPANRCLAPFTRFAEYDDASPKGGKVMRVFTLQAEPMAMFAGIWRAWRGPRGPKKSPVVGEHLLFAILTTEANESVRPIHAKAMPVILSTPAEYEQWLTAPAEEIPAIQERLFPPERLVLRPEMLKPSASLIELA